MKYKNTFSMIDGSIDRSEFKIVLIQERNKYVSEIMKVLMDSRGISYVDAKAILQNVYPRAFDFAIQAIDFDDRMSERSRGSSVWTTQGSTASSMWRAHQAVQGQQQVESTVFNWFLRKATYVLTTCSETLMHGTMGVATLPGAYEPPIFGRQPSPAQFRALSCATHAVTVFDKWMETLQSAELIARMPSMEPVAFGRSLERIKMFYRLKCETKILENGDIVYVMDAKNVTGLRDTLRAIEEADDKCLSAILQHSQDPAQQEDMLRISALEVQAAAVAPLAAEPEVNESSNIALANIIPPAQILEAIAVDKAAGGAAAAAGGDDSMGLQEQVIRQADEMSDSDEQGGIEQKRGGSRSRKRSASKRTRRKGVAKKEKSKKNKRQSRRKARRSSSRKAGRK
jgi:hypothetical protein